MAALLLAAASGDERLRYGIEIGGVEAGRVGVEAKEAGAMRELAVDWRIDGMLGLLGRSGGSMEGQSRSEKDGALPVRFESRSKKSEREREAVLVYDAAGEIDELDLTRNGKARRSEVPKDLRQGTVDTLTAFWQLRDWLAGRPEAGGEGKAIAVFDGRLRYDLVPRFLGRDGDKQRFALRLVPRSGFDDNEVFGSEIDPDQPWAEVSVGPELVPVEIKGQGRLPWRILLKD